VLADPDVIKALELQGIEATPTTPDELRTRIEADIAKWKKLAEETGISMEDK
jgi:tripartite-type tricarboxylate transporter receptor subunit TctC